MRVVGGIAVFICAVALVFSAFLFGNRFINHMGGVQCLRQGVERNVAAKWSDQGYNEWVCLMRLPDGHWVPSWNYNTSLRDYYLGGARP